MGCYVIAVGGTGNKILEAIVYAACVDAFYTEDERGKRTPIPELHALSVDVDTACGNTTRAKRAAEYYESVRECFSASPQTHRCFHTAVHVDKWSMNLSRRASSIRQMTQNHARDQLLSKTLFSKTEASLEYSEGFRGHPDLGVLFFTDLLSSIPTRVSQGQPDELWDLVLQMRSDIARGERVKVILCGSIFGGTGASGIPALSKYLRSLFKDDSDLFELGSMLMLPYYKVPPSSHNEALEIVVKSSTFLDKARTALQYYGMEGMIRDSEDDPSGVFDAVYLLGLPPEGFVSTSIYSTGSQSQENDAHMLEWLAARCIARFFRTGFRGTDAHNIDCYYYQWHTPTFMWSSFDSDAASYVAGYGALIKASAAFFSEYYPTLRAAVSDERGHALRIGYCAPYFYRVSRYTATQRSGLEKRLDALYHFLAFYSNWMLQVLHSLPPTMRQRRASEADVLLAATNYDQLVQRAVLLQTPSSEQLTNAQQEELKRLTTEYEAMERERLRLLPRIGGRAWLEVLRNAQLSARAQLSRQEEDVSTLKERLDRWRGVDAHLADPQEVRQEEERLSAMRRVHIELDARLSKIGSDIEAAIRQDVVSRYPAPATTDERFPQNDLLDHTLLASLSSLLNEYGLPESKRNPDRMQRDRIALQKGLHHLVLTPVPDKRDMARITAGLGGSECDVKYPDAALAGFLTALLSAVWEEDAL